MTPSADEKIDALIHRDVMAYGAATDEMMLADISAERRLIKLRQEISYFFGLVISRNDEAIKRLGPNACSFKASMKRCRLTSRRAG